MKKHLALLLLPFFCFSYTIAQETFPYNGVKEKVNNYYAFTHATIYIDYRTKLENATLLLQDGVILNIDTEVDIPQGAVIYDLEGKYIYPSLIDCYTNYGMPTLKEARERGHNASPNTERNDKGAKHWNEAIHPEEKARDLFAINNKQAEEWRKLGFGMVLSHQTDGIARGTSTLVSLAEGKENEVVVLGEAAAHYSFRKGSSPQGYPSSLMGSIALLRQTYFDAQWYKSSVQKEYNISLETFNSTQELPQFFEVNDYLSFLRADKIGDEFDVQYIIKGDGDEYKRIDAIKATNATVIATVDFPQVYDVEDPYTARDVSLSAMKHWEMAPTNLSYLQKNAIPFALTTYGLKEKADFWKNIRKAIQHGLSEETALKALTSLPAQLLKADNKIGSLKRGMSASFIITSGNLFNEKNILYENWIQGKQYIINDYNVVDVRGEYNVNINNVIYHLEVKGEIAHPKANFLINDTNKVKVSIKQDNNIITLNFNPDDNHYKGFIRLNGKINYKSGSWDGNGQLPNGKWVAWSAIKKAPFKEKEQDTIRNDSTSIGQLWYPNMAYGWTKLPKAKKVLIQYATVWTNEAEGVLNNTDVLLIDGKIVQVGQNITDTLNAEIVDGTGKHLTAGIIDEHSHIAISRGVNEGTQAVTSEVSIADVVNTDDINIYRQLGGGVVAAQLLHGSANPIGGQSAVVKLRWGMMPEEMKIKGADNFIKFALGENVKQSNWGANSTKRFPQTRMGVEQIFYDAFIRAKEYQQQWDTYNALDKKKKPKATPPRKDLELEALAEILNHKRFITCHSYVQSEINMLMHVADSLGFTINTFTHILEGYKIADKMKDHGAGASTFSDWWAYKFEVYDAIPYNSSLLNEKGIVTAVNSDDAEMGRRLNQEAAKAIKYGGMSEEDALKLVTLNPAKLLHLDNRMGSIKAGKDADVVLWSDNPLSIYAKVEKTFVDGICYYDIEQDIILRDATNKERARLIGLMIQAKKEGNNTQKPKKESNHPYHCDSLEVE